MFSKWKWCNLLLLDTKVNANLLADKYQLKQPQEGAPRKKLLQKLDTKEGEEWQIYNEKNIVMLLRRRLLDFLLFQIKGNHK